MTPMDWVWLYLAGIPVCAIIIGARDAEELIPFLPVWPVVVAGICFFWFLRFFVKLGEKLREHS